MPYETPNQANENRLCWRFSLPDSPQFISLFFGALSELAQAKNYRLVGDMTPNQTAELFAQVLYEAEQTACMIGAVVSSPLEVSPFGWLPCNGTTYNRADYPLLYAVLPSSLKVSADSFVTPDLRSRTIYGAGQGSGLSDYPLLSTGGLESVSLTVDQLPAHSHTTIEHNHTTVPHGHADAGHAHSEVGAASTVINGGIEAPAPAATPLPLSTGVGFANIQAATVEVVGATVTVNETGQGEAVSIVPPFIALHYYIIAR